MCILSFFCRAGVSRSFASTPASYEIFEFYVRCLFFFVEPRASVSLVRPPAACTSFLSACIFSLFAMYVANVGIRERMERAPGWRLNDPPSLSFLNIYLRTNGEKREERRSANVSILSLSHRCQSIRTRCNALLNIIKIYIINNNIIFLIIIN